MAGETGGQCRDRGKRRLQLGRQHRAGKQLADLGGRLEAGAQAAEVARAAAVERQPRQRARHVGDALQRGAQAFAQPWLGQEERHRIQPAR